MPFPNAHAARILDPKLFQKETFRTIPIKDGITAIVGKLKEKESMTIQAYRFEVEKFTVEQAKKWLDDHGIKYISFEKAEKESSIKAAHYVGMKDGILKIVLYGGIDECEVDCNELATYVMEAQNDDSVKEIEIHINTPGGSVINGMSLVSALLASEKPVTTVNDGMALSMGGVILMAGNKIKMSDIGVLMIHEPHIMGETADETENEKAKNALTALREQLITIFVKRTGNSRKDIEETMKNETWLNAIEAKAKGFIDEIIETKTHGEDREWDTEYINKLPDSAFAIVLPGGEKDDDGLTVPRTLRKLPYRGMDGNVDLPHLRNALARLPQTDLTSEQKKKALGVLQKAKKEAGMEDKYFDATGYTSENDGHSHEYDIDESGNGKTIAGIPETVKHVHEIEKFIVLPKENHDHELKWAKTGTSNAVIKASMGMNGKTWEVVVISAGYANTLTGKFYVSDEVLKASLDCFNDVGVYCHQWGMTPDGKFDLRHRPNGMENANGLFGNKVGWISDARYDSEDGRGVVKATFHCIDESVRNKLVEIWATDKTKMPQFSVDMGYTAKRVGNTGYVEKFSKANSLDMVTEGAFDGAGFDRLVAGSTKEEHMKTFFEKLLARVKAGTLKLVDSEGKSDDILMSMLKAALGVTGDEADNTFDDGEIDAMIEMKDFDSIRDAMVKKKKMAAVVPAPIVTVPAAQAPAVSVEEFNKLATDMKAMRLTASVNLVERVLAESKLDDMIKTRVRKSFANRVDVTEKEVNDEIAGWKKDIDRMTASGSVHGIPVVAMGDNAIDKRLKRFECFVNPRLEGTEGYEGIRGFSSFKDAMLAWVPGAQGFDSSSMKAAATSDFPNIFEDVMNKQIRKQYDLATASAEWKKLVDEVPLDTLDTQHIYDMGGFGLLPDVSEGGTYAEASTPSEEEAYYTPKKIGNVFTITEEMMFTSDSKMTQLVRGIPRNMAASGVATLSKFVYDLITGCDGSSGPNSKTISIDSKTLYHADHGTNFGSSALDYSTFYAGYLAMSNQTKLSTGIPADIRAAYLLVPNELLPTAINVCKGEVYPSQTSNGVAIQNPYSGLGVTPIGVPKYYLCNDANNWYLVGNKNGYPTLQVGYFQNQRMPQMFLQNTDTVGNVFTADKWTYKVKWRFGAAITDYRTFYAGLVS